MVSPVFAVLLFTVASTPHGEGDPLPPVVERILAGSERFDLISLDPSLLMPGSTAPPTGDVFHGWPVLGRARVSGATTRAEILSALKRGLSEHDGGVGGCFSPAHGLRAELGADVLEIVICFGCAHFHAFVNGELVPRLDGTSESPMAVLDRVMVDANVALSFRPDPEKEATARRARAIENGARERRWVAGMPEALRPLWRESRRAILQAGEIRDLGPWRAVLERELPDAAERIRALLTWYGSGAGPWSGFPAYEASAEDVLLEFSTATLVDAVTQAPLTTEELEGAARLFGGWEFRKQRPNDGRLLPVDLKRTLLAHALQTEDEDKRRRAERAFAN